MRSECRAETVVARLVAPRPIAERLVHRIFQRGGARRHRHDFRPQKPHFAYVRRLALDVGLPHVDYALEAQQGAGRSCCEAMLSRSRFGNDARFPHFFSQKTLADRVVDFVGPRVEKIFPF